MSQAGPGATRGERSGRTIRVLVVDDSAVMRQVMTAILSREPDMEVVIAQEPFIAMRKMKEALPDVILLDLQMPKMDGLTFLRQLRATHAIPVVICSAFSGANSQAAVRALEQGAIDIVRKPELGLREFLDEAAPSLIELIRAAAGAKIERRATAGSPLADAEESAEPDHLHRTADAILPKPKPRPWTGVTRFSDRIIALGASVGGTNALHEVLGAMPADCPGIVVVQHMPAGFTAAFAQRLDETCRIEVREAKDGDRVVAGRALIAAGNQHLLVVRRADGYHVLVRSGPTVSRHRPSVDVLFRSVAASAGSRAVAALMTGMGEDGAAGLLELRLGGATTIAQDEASCVVFGMPKEAIARGAVEHVVPLARIAPTILSAAQSR
ncbi:MAG TPA: chemotaxis response regulator protein-glutamate methylesterase [Polyangiales bacterium]|nr:chemotaxis response regulator protein-glutamate methylesterase [Polyangiales bacterium]